VSRGLLEPSAGLDDLIAEQRDLTTQEVGLGVLLDLHRAPEDGLAGGVVGGGEVGASEQLHRRHRRLRALEGGPGLVHGVGGAAGGEPGLGHGDAQPERLRVLLQRRLDRAGGLRAAPEGVQDAHLEQPRRAVGGVGGDGELQFGERVQHPALAHPDAGDDRVAGRLAVRGRDGRRRLGLGAAELALVDESPGLPRLALPWAHVGRRLVHCRRGGRRCGQALRRCLGSRRRRGRSLGAGRLADGLGDGGGRRHQRGREGQRREAESTHQRTSGMRVSSE
jgi:hypothetical protein